MRRIIVALLIYLALGLIPGSVRPPPPLDDSRAIAIVNGPGSALGMRFGGLTLTEAWQLTSPNPRFGGLSGLALTGPRRLRAVGDSGFRVDLEMGRSGDDSKGLWVDLPPPRAGLTEKHFLDAEAIGFDPMTGQSWIAFEGTAQIWRFNVRGDRTAWVRNPVMEQWPANGGAESLVRLPDRRFIVVSERRVADGLHEGVLFSGDPTLRRTRSTRFTYDSQDRGSVVDAATLPDGRILILHRKLGINPVFTSVVALADPRTLSAGGALTGRTIAVIRHPEIAENYEGMAIEPGPDGLGLWLISDDNLNDWQRTRLLRFRIDPATLR